MKYCPACGIVEHEMGLKVCDTDFFCLCGWSGKYADMLDSFRALIKKAHIERKSKCWYTDMEPYV